MPTIAHIKSTQQGKKFRQKEWEDPKAGQFWLLRVKQLRQTIMNWLKLLPQSQSVGNVGSVLVSISQEFRMLAPDLIHFIL